MSGRNFENLRLLSGPVAEAHELAGLPFGFSKYFWGTTGLGDVPHQQPKYCAFLYTARGRKQITLSRALWVSILR